MRNRAYWQERLELAQKKLADLLERLENNPDLQAEPRFYHQGWRVTARNRKAFRKARRHHVTMVRQVKMLTMTKIPYYKERIRSLTPSLWDRLLDD